MGQCASPIRVAGKSVNRTGQAHAKLRVGVKVVSMADHGRTQVRDRQQLFLVVGFFNFG